MPRKKGRLARLVSGVFERRPLPLPIVIALDVLLLGAALVVFALFHHVIPRKGTPVGTVSSREGAAQTVVIEVAAPSVAPEEPEPTVAAAVGDFSLLYPEGFSASGAREWNEGDTYVYQSENVRIANTPHSEDFGDGMVNYYVSDILVRDISNFQTALAKDTYGRGYREETAALAARSGALIAVNGDYYGSRSEGIVMRNGTLYRQSEFGDICVLYWDGTMETYLQHDVDPEAILARGPYQIWSFGPELLDDEGQKMAAFNSAVAPNNPRTAIGYFAPGHYCFVVVDGRSSASKGVTLSQLSELMFKLGCKRAYNLDGGQTSVMTWRGEIVNRPAEGGRPCSDIIMIVE